MKQTIALLLVLVVSLLCFAGCKKGEPSQPVTLPGVTPTEGQEAQGSDPTDPSSEPTTPTTQPTTPSSEPTTPTTAPTTPTTPPTEPTTPTTQPPTEPSSNPNGGSNEAVVEDGDIFIPLG